MCRYDIYILLNNVHCTLRARSMSLYFGGIPDVGGLSRAKWEAECESLVQ